jgi:hypothetical protein
MSLGRRELAGPGRRIRPPRGWPHQVRVGVTAYLGYQEVLRPGRARYAQVRMAGVFPVKSAC